MKRLKLFAVVCWFMCSLILSFNFLLSKAENGLDKDVHGKFVCQIVDPETGEPIKEPFEIAFYDSKDDRYPSNRFRTVETDENGRLVLELPPYPFYLQFYPSSVSSKYCISPYPFYIKEADRMVAQVETGKITYIRKKAELGGTIKIYTADINNTRFNPEEKFNQKFQIATVISSANLYKGFPSVRDDLNNGELTVNRLHPGEYWVRVSFEGVGYRTIKKENILVEKGETAEVFINVDLNDNTGIEGVVTDANGIPIEDADITLGNDDKSMGYGFEAYTDKNGYYKLSGIPEGYYYLGYGYTCKTRGKGTISFSKGIIEVKKNVLLRLDIKFKYTINEMEAK